jgi:NAD(P)H-nitrite reductase large subunit
MRIAVIGSGIAGVSFAEELLKLQPANSITLLTRETHGYYSRPLLSHGFTRADIESKIILRSFDSLEQTGIHVASGVDVTAFDRATKTLSYRKNGEELTLVYDRLVLALGSAAFVPPPFLPQNGLFNVLNSLDDLIGLRRHREELSRASRVPRWAVIGGGLIGCEVASDLAKAGDRVVLFHALPRLMERQLVAEDSAELLRVLREENGVEVRLNCDVRGFSETSEGLAVRLDGDAQTGFHGIIVACGFKPRTELAHAAGLETRRGIVVNDFLTTTDPDVFASGDVAECPDGKLYAYVTPVRSQALWLAKFLTGVTDEPWHPPLFKPKAKVHGFTAAHPYLF